MENKVYFIINKYSGTGFQSSVEGRIIDACAARNIEATVEYTQHKGHATELARQAVFEGYKRVFVMGGDGTINEVARGLVHTNVAMGILPKGSGNGLARHLNIPLALSRALQLLDRFQSISMDTMLINDHVSVNVSGVGFDAHVAAQFGKNGKRGLIGYSRVVVREYLKFKEFQVGLRMEEQVLSHRCFIVAFANSSQFGNNAKVSPFASVCDQLIDVCLIRKVPLAWAAGFAQKMFMGQMNRSRYVKILQGKHLSVEFDEPMPYHIDGESMPPARRFEVVIVPHSLRVIVPDNASHRH